VPTIASPVRFGLFEVDLRSGELRKSGIKVRLADQPFQILTLLLEHPGEVVTREELRQRLWSADTFVDFEHGLNAAVKRLREALGDTADNPMFIETLPKHGYRFIAPVESLATPNDATEITGPDKKSRWPYYVALACVGAIAAAAIFHFYSHRKPLLTDKDFILLAEFANQTDQPVFDDTLKQALVIQLQQSPYLSIVPEQNIRATLTAMGHSPDEKLTENLAREVCVRENIKAMLIGSIASLGSEYVIGVRAIDCRTGAALATEQITAASKEKVLQAMSKVCTRLRKQLGESLPSIQKYDRPLEEASTQSLEALQALSRGREAARRGQQLEAISYFQRAVEVDPNLAWAYAAMATAYGNLNEETRGMEAMKKAYALRNRVSERERLHIEMTYHWLVTGDRDKELEIQRLFSETYPRETSPLNNLGLNYSLFFGEYAKGIEVGNRLLKLNPHVAGAYLSIGCGDLGQNQIEDAKRSFEEGLRQMPETQLFHVWLYATAFLQGNEAGMSRECESAAGNVEESILPGVFAASAAAQAGKIRESRQLAAQGAETARMHGYKDYASGFVADHALTEAEVGNFSKAREYAAASMKLSNTRTNLPTISVALAMAGDKASAQRIVSDLYRRFPEDTWINFIYGPCAEAMMKGSNPIKALENLQAAHRYELGIYNRLLPIYVRGLTYLREGEPTEAAAEFQRLIDHRGSAPVAPEYALAHLGLARAYAAAGDKAKSRKAYQQFLDLWKDADPDVPILGEAKADYAKLGNGSI
jgi:DNA-binding winged helix-turn-helix (wHTH) protein/tetratricopeptide (TPR) repeat protein